MKIPEKLRNFILLSIIFLLGSLSSNAKMLEPVKWSFKIKMTGENTAELQCIATIDQGWHLYSQHLPADGPLPTEFKFDKTPGVEYIGGVVEPLGREEYDEMFKLKIKFFDKSAVFSQKVKLNNAKPVVIKGELSYQTCDDVSCVPGDAEFSFNLPGVQIAANTDNSDTTAVAIAVPASDTSAQAKVAPIANSDEFTGKNRTLLWFFLQAFLWGLLAILTPCVFPMIQMTVSYFMKSGSKGKVQAIVYGFSIVAIYVIFGVLIAVLFGADFGNWLSTHWLPNVLFFIIFVVFAASFFGYFEITVPSWLVNKSVKNEEKGGLMGTVFMAFTLVLVSFSCTGPIVGTVVVQAVG